MAQKKMGRPLSGEKPLKDRIFVLVDDETQQKLAFCKQMLKTTASDVVRRGIDRMYDDLKK
ncbi:MAG: CopG family transcriptional regulator [Acutalibacteraceae bacterium]|nr:CopG family transcriptional regulator [Clostridiales bacterium]